LVAVVLEEVELPGQMKVVIHLLVQLQQRVVVEAHGLRVVKILMVVLAEREVELLEVELREVEHGPKVLEVDLV
jgi:hypothetical protein